MLVGCCFKNSQTRGKNLSRVPNFSFLKPHKIWRIDLSLRTNQVLDFGNDVLLGKALSRQWTNQEHARRSFPLTGALAKLEIIASPRTIKKLCTGSPARLRGWEPCDYGNSCFRTCCSLITCTSWERPAIGASVNVAYNLAAAWNPCSCLFDVVKWNTVIQFYRWASNKLYGPFKICFLAVISWHERYY